MLLIHLLCQRHCRHLWELPKQFFDIITRFCICHIRFSSANLHATMSLSSPRCFQSQYLAFSPTTLTSPTLKATQTKSFGSQGGLLPPFQSTHPSPSWAIAVIISSLRLFLHFLRNRLFICLLAF